MRILKMPICMGIFSLCIVSSLFQAVYVLKPTGIMTISALDLLSASLVFATMLYGNQSKYLLWYLFIVSYSLVTMIVQYLLGNDVSYLHYLLYSIRFMACVALLMLAIEVVKEQVYVEHILKLLRVLAVFSVLFSVYESVFVLNFGFPKLVPTFLDGAYQPISRFRGLFSESSLYALYLFPIFIYSLKTKSFTYSIFIGLGLLMTKSSFLAVGLVLLVIMSVKNVKSILKLATIIFVSILLFTYLFGIDEFLYSFWHKFNNYIYMISEGSVATVSDSGGIRAYTTLLGFYIYLDNPILGVGLGNAAQYTTALIDHSLVNSGLMNYSIPIQSAIPHLIAEQGTIGLLILYIVLYFLSQLIKPLSIRNKLCWVGYFFYIMFVMYPINNVLIFSFLIIYALVLRVLEHQSIGRF